MTINRIFIFRGRFLRKFIVNPRDDTYSIVKV